MSGFSKLKFGDGLTVTDEGSGVVRIDGGGGTGPPGPQGETGPAGATGPAGPNLVDGSTPTPLTGLLKGNGTDVDVAVAGTDYVLPATLDGKVDKDSVVVAATRVVQSKLLAGDAQPAFRILGDGRQDWGPGGSTAPDTNLYRSAAATLKTDGSIHAVANLAAQAGLAGQVLVGNFGLGAGIAFGSAADANLYRLAAGILKTDGQFRTTNEILGPIGPSNESGLRLGGDTNLYRAAAGQLATDGFFFAQVTAGLAALGARRSGDSGWRFYIGSDGDLVWGLAAGSYDTYLRRSAAGTLRVNSVLDVETHIYAAGGTTQQITLHSNGQIYFGNAFDTWLYRRVGNKVGTIGSFTAEGAVTGWGFEAFGSGETQPRAMLRNDAQLLFGPGGSSAMDTSLYRSGAGFLRTDGTLQVGSTAGTGIHFLASAATNTVVMTGKMIGGALGALTTTLEVKIDGVSYRIPVYV